MSGLSVSALVSTGPGLDLTGSECINTNKLAPSRPDWVAVWWVGQGRVPLKGQPAWLDPWQMRG